MIFITLTRLIRETERLAAILKLLVTLSLFSGLIFWETPAFAQDPPDVAQGMNPASTYHGSDIDYVEMVTGRLNLHIPLVIDHSQRGKLNFTYSLSSSGSTWYQRSSCTVTGCIYPWEPGIRGGVGLGIDGHIDHLATYHCNITNCGTNITVDSAIADDGSSHHLGTITSSPLLEESIDGSGIQRTVNSSSSLANFINKDGIQFNEPVFNVTTLAFTKVIEDTNGNEISISGVMGGSPYTTKDTLGRTWTQTFGSTNVTGCPVAAVKSTLWDIPGPVNINNGVREFKFCYSNVSIQTSLGGVKSVEYSGTFQLVTGVVLPDGTTWRFDYNSYGDLAKVYLPTGGTITYQYVAGDPCGTGNMIDQVTQRTVFDGTNSNTWHYYNLGGSYTGGIRATDPLGNDIVNIPYGGPGCTMGIGKIQYYAGSYNAGTLIKTVTKAYRTLPDPYLNDNGQGGAEPILLTSTITDWGPSPTTGQTNQAQQSYDSGFTFSDTNLTAAHGNYQTVYGLVASESQSDYGSGSPGPILSSTTSGYWYTSNPNYVTANILSLPSSVITTNVSGYKCAETDYGYDIAAQIVASGVTEQHVAAPSPGILGNLTSVTRQLSSTPCQSGGSWSSLPPTKNYIYDTGMVQKSVDPLTNPTTYSYSGSYYGAFPTTVTNALNQSMTYTYDFNTGLMASLKDPNSQTTSFQYDVMLRPTQANYPDTGQTTIAYNYSGNVFVGDTFTKIATPDPSIVTTQVFDGLGRLKQTQRTSDPAGTDYTDTTYDADGRTFSVSNPYRSTSDTTYGLTKTYYDPLARPCLVVPADGTPPSSYSCPTTSPGNDILTVYAGNCTTVTDEAGKSRKSCVDGAGRMTGVWEDPNVLNYPTSYTYDALDNLLSVAQSGSRQRTFTYDSLSRLTSAYNPESGNTCYAPYSGGACQYLTASGYDGDSNLLTKTDARGITTTYAYDALNRLTSKTYLDSTPGAYFTYDQTSALGLTLTNPIGRLTSEGTFSNGAWVTLSAFSYDPLGRVNVEVPCLGTTNCVAGEFGYDLAGDIDAVIYPSTRNVITLYNGAMQPTQVTFTKFNNTTFGYNYLSTATYAPTGAPTSMTLGSGVIETDCYNNRLQPGNMQIAGGTFTWLNRTYNFYSSGSGGCTSGSSGNNGNVMTIADNIQSNRTQSFGYDNLNRISTAQSAATSGADCWGQSFGYDAWANLLTENVTKCSGTQLSVGVNTQNRITNSGISYDAAGNMLTDGIKTYTYDAENRITTLNGTAATYTYDAEGQRVNKQTGSNTTEYVYFKGQPIAENASGVWTDYIFAGSRRLASSIGTNESSITNGSFEKGLTNWSTSGTATLVTNAANAHSGSNYVQISATSGGYSGVNNQFISVQPGDQITFGGWVNLQSGSSSTPPGWMLGVYNSSLTAITYILSTSPSSSGWMYQSVNYTVPFGGAYVVLFAEVNQPSGSTVIWVDDGFISTGTSYYHGDHLGSARVMSDTGGNVIWSATYLPFGQEWNPQPTVNHYKFTGKERDSESGLDNFGARYDSSQYGRFMSPDPMGGHFTNPQSLNRYSYVHNNPLSMIDPNGLDCVYVVHGADKQDVGYVVSGDCISEKDDGIFVNGNVNTAAGATMDSTNNTMSFYYTPDGASSSAMYHTDTPDPTSASYLDPGSTSYGFGSSNYGAQAFSQAYQNSRAVTNPKNIAGFYGTSAVAGASGLAAASATTASELAALAAKLATLGGAGYQLGQQLLYDPEVYGFLSDLAQGYSPGSVPATLGGISGACAGGGCGGLVQAGQQMYQTGQQMYQNVRGSVPH